MDTFRIGASYKILLAIYKTNLGKNVTEAYSSQIHFDTKITPAHVNKCVKQLKKLDLVTSEKDGRIDRLKLTDKGLELAKNLLSIQEKTVEVKLK